MKDPGAKRTTPYEVIVGEVKPLTVSKLAADNGGEGERKLVVTFSKKLAEEINNDNAGRYLHVSPAPANLKYDVTNREVVTVAGDFALDRSYAVTVDAGTPAAEEGVKLAAASTQAAQFDRRPPQLAFPDFSTQQLGVGRREFDLFALNVPDVHLRIKLVPPDQAPLALAQYQKQYYTPNEGHTEKNRVNFDKMPGKIVYDAKVKGAPTVDKPETIRLKWDELLGPGRNGVLLLEAEQPAAPKGQKRLGVQALVQVTNLGVVWQIAPGEKFHTFVFSLADASPVGKATVRCFDADGKPLGKKPADSTATADANGLAALSHRRGEHRLAGSRVRRRLPRRAVYPKRAQRGFPLRIPLAGHRLPERGQRGQFRHRRRQQYERFHRPESTRPARRACLQRPRRLQTRRDRAVQGHRARVARRRVCQRFT